MLTGGGQESTISAAAQKVEGSYSPAKNDSGGGGGAAAGGFAPMPSDFEIGDMALNFDLGTMDLDCWLAMDGSFGVVEGSGQVV